jgi:DNA polymerase III subunit epsilon
VLARRKHTGGLTLDDLCVRYGVDRSHRTQRGALLDAELLASVYVELTMTRQAALQLDPIKSEPASVHATVRTRPQSLPSRVTADDSNAHRAFVQTLGRDAVWLDYFVIKSVAA